MWVDTCKLCIWLHALHVMHHASCSQLSVVPSHRLLCNCMLSICACAHTISCAHSCTINTMHTPMTMRFLVRLRHSLICCCLTLHAAHMHRVILHAMNAMHSNYICNRSSYRVSAWVLGYGGSCLNEQPKE